MSKSFDGFWDGGTFSLTKVIPGQDKPVRVVPWTCPYPPEQVPQHDELVSRGGVHWLIQGVPKQDQNKRWYLNACHDGDHVTIGIKHILKLPAPTVTLSNGKTYDDAAVIERCKGLEEV